MNSTAPALHYASWQEWSAADYLKEYYQELMPDERYALEFLVASLRDLPELPVALDFGAGPTLHHAFPLVNVAREIHLAEYLPANRAAIQSWLERDDDAHDWSAFTREILRLEGNQQPTGGTSRRGSGKRGSVSRVSGLLTLAIRIRWEQICALTILW